MILNSFSVGLQMSRRAANVTELFAKVVTLQLCIFKFGGLEQFRPPPHDIQTVSMSFLSRKPHSLNQKFKGTLSPPAPLYLMT